MTIIKGSDVLGIVNDIPIFCGLGLTFTEDKDTFERTPDFGTAGVWTYSRLVKRGWSVEVTGLTKIDPSDGQEDYFTMISDPFNYSYQVITLSFTDQEGNNISIAGVMFMQKSSITGPATGFAQASVTFIGTGEYILSTDGSGSGSITPCEPVGGGAFVPPDGTLNTPYSYTYPLTGSLPFTLGAFSGLPGSISPAVVGADLILSGTPTNYPADVGTFFPDIIVQNDCGTIDLIYETGFTITEDGRNVFVINNSSSNVTLTNDNGHSYTFLASNGSDGNIKMQSDTVNITSVTGTKNYEFLQTLPSTVINSGTFSSGNNLTTADLSITNYLRFSD